MEYNFGEKSAVQLQWVVKSTDYSKAKCDEIASKFARKYGLDARKVHVKPKIIASTVTVETGNNTIRDIREPAFQQKLMKRYIQENDIKGCDWETIATIDAMVNSQIDYASYEKQKAFDIKYIKFDNFMAYGSGQFISFEGLDGLVLIEGSPSNQCGKSTFCVDLVHMGLYGKAIPGRADTFAGIFNKNRPDVNQVYIEVGLVINGETYVIKRTFTRPEEGRKNRDKVTQKVLYYHIIDGTETEMADSENCTGLGSAETNKIIKDALGSDKDFDAIVSSTADNLKSNIALKQADRDRMMLNFMGLDVLQEKDTIARELWNKQVRPKLIVEAYNREELLGNIDALNEDSKRIDGIIKKKEGLSIEINGKINAYQKQRDDLLGSKLAIDDRLSQYDITTVKQSMEDVKNEGVVKKHQCEDKQARISEIGDVGFSSTEYREKQDEKVRLISDINVLKSEIIALRKMNETLANSEYCPVCKRKFENVDHSEEIAKNESEVARKIEEGKVLKSKLDTVSLELDAMEESRTLANEKGKLELEISAMNSNLSLLREKYIKYQNIIKGLNDNNDAIVHNNQVDANINMIDASIRQEKNTLDSIRSEIASLEKDKAGNEAGINQRKELLERLDEDTKVYRHWQCYLAMVGRDGIPKCVLREALPIINEKIAYYLGGGVDFSVEVAINDKNEVCFYLVKDDVKVPLSTGSGYEQTMSSLALRAALGIISTLPKPPFLLFDEVLGGVAKENYENVHSLMDRICTDYHRIFQITHLEDIKPWHNHVLHVSKNEQGISSIRVEK